MKNLLSILVMSMFALTSFAQLSGTYTINAGSSTAGTNFNSFSDAAAALNTNGVSGPVVMNVVPNSGPYNDQVSLDSINGLGATNTLTFNGNGNIIYTTTVPAKKAVFKINGCPYVTIDSLRVKANSLSDAVGIHVLNGSNKSVIRNCIIDLDSVPASTSVDVVGIAVNGFDIWTNGNGTTFDVTVEGNLILGGPSGPGFGIKMTGGGFPATYTSGHIVRNNTVINALFWGIVVEYMDSVLVRGNDISRPGSTSGDFGGIILGSGATNVIVENNFIHNTHDAMSGTSDAKGISLSYATPSSGGYNLIRNNVMYNFNGSGSDYGFYASNSTNVKIYNNTVSFDNTAATGGNCYGFYHTSSPASYEFLNNIVSITRGGSGTKYMVYFNGGSPNVALDNNVYYLNSTGSGSQYYSYWNSTSYAQLSNWQSANSGAFDSSSVNYNPSFISIAGNNYRPSSASVNDIAAPLVLVPLDIEGNIRSSMTPDPGAYETVPPKLDAGILSIDSILNSCAGTIPVYATLKNIGTDTLKTVTIGWKVNGISQTSLAHVTNLPVQQSEAVLLGNLTISNGFTYDLLAYTSNPNATVDTLNANDTAYIVNMETALNGYYTIGSSGNYSDPLAAVLDLNKRGVCGPVFFDVDSASGPFTDQLQFLTISGTSKSDSIVFEGNGSKLTVDMTSKEFFVVQFNTTSYVTFRNFDLEASGSSSYDGGGVYLTNGCHHIVVHDCQIDMSPIMTSSFETGGIYAGGPANAPTVANFCELRNNRILALGVRNGIFAQGSSGPTGLYGNVFKDNIATDFYFTGYYQAWGDSNIVDGNDFSRPNATHNWTFAGIRLYENSQNTLIQNNRIHNSSNQTPFYSTNCTGISVINCDAPASKPNVVQNNLIYKFNNGGLHLGIVTEYSDGLHCYHNTIVFDHNGTSGGAQGIYQRIQATDLSFRNNLIYITKSGSDEKFAYSFQTTTSGIDCDFNALYLDTLDANAYVGKIGTTSIKKLKNWILNSNNSNRDHSSVFANPLFVNAAQFNFTPSSCLIDNAGDSLGVMWDILDSIRDFSTPDPGAFEFDAPYIHVSAQADTTVCLDKTFELASDSGFARYKWSTGGNSNVESILAADLGLGDSLITVIAWDSNGCKSMDEVLVTVEDCNPGSGLDELSNVLAWSIYPNPSNGMLFISIESSVGDLSTIDVLSAQGQVAGTSKHYLAEGRNLIELSLSDLPKGMYLIRITTDSGALSRPIMLK